MDNNDLVAYYDDYYRCWHSGFRGWCKKNGHKGLILVQPASWVKENLVLGAKNAEQPVSSDSLNLGSEDKVN